MLSLGKRAIHHLKQTFILKNIFFKFSTSNNYLNDLLQELESKPKAEIKCEEPNVNY